MTPMTPMTPYDSPQAHPQAHPQAFNVQMYKFYINGIILSTLQNNTVFESIGWPLKGPFLLKASYTG